MAFKTLHIADPFDVGNAVSSAMRQDQIVFGVAVSESVVTATSGPELPVSIQAEDDASKWPELPQGDRATVL